jgi:hypothetical protein
MDAWQFMQSHNLSQVWQYCRECGSSERVGGDEKLCHQCRKDRHERANPPCPVSQKKESKKRTQVKKIS